MGKIIFLESGGLVEVWLWSEMLDLACADRLNMEGGKTGRSIIFRCSAVQRVPN
jgi:hypothetical protein